MSANISERGKIFNYLLILSHVRSNLADESNCTYNFSFLLLMEPSISPNPSYETLNELHRKHAPLCDSGFMRVCDHHVAARRSDPDRVTGTNKFRSQRQSRNQSGRACWEAARFRVVPHEILMLEKLLPGNIFRCCQNLLLRSPIFGDMFENQNWDIQEEPMRNKPMVIVKCSYRFIKDEKKKIFVSKLKNQSNLFKVTTVTLGHTEMTQIVFLIVTVLWRRHTTFCTSFSEFLNPPCV
jgi:hypothetical protein